jgi:ABC-type microcin C transport system permease subunit YejB
VIAFVVRRLLLAVPTLFGVLVVTFLLLYVAPGDPVQEMVGERADQETIDRLRRELKLDQPLHVQFGHYASGIVRGDLGRSYITNRPIIQDIRERFPKTMLLALTAMAIASITGIFLGVISARNAGGWIDRFSLGVAYLGISFPVYWVGLLLILLFAVILQWLPPSGYGKISYLILPALALGSRSIAFLARVTTPRKHGRHEACAPECADPDHYGPWPGLRQLPDGKHPHGNDLQLAGDRALCGERNRPAGPAGDPGLDPVPERGVRAGEPDYRPGVCEG